MPEARAPRRDAAANRLSLLDAARAVLARDPDAPLDAIVAAAGLSRRAFYGHFASREQLVAEVARRGAERIAAAVGGLRHDDPLVELALLGAGLWEQVDDVRVLAQAAVRGPSRTVVADALAPLRARIADLVTRGAAAGRIRRDIRPAPLARLVEAAALAVLDEATRERLGTAEGRALAIATLLSLAGLSWQEAGDLAATEPALAGSRGR